MAVMTLTRQESGESNKDFLFLSGELKSMDDQTNVLSVSIDFPGDDDTEDSSFSLNLGQENTYTFQFKLYTETTDRSNGTDSSIQTFEQIIPYLKRTVFKKSIGEVLYRIQLTTKFESIDAMFELQDFSIGTNDGLYPSGNIKLKFRYYN